MRRTAAKQNYPYLYSYIVVAALSHQQGVSETVLECRGLLICRACIEEKGTMEHLLREYSALQFTRLTEMGVA